LVHVPDIAVDPEYAVPEGETLSGKELVPDLVVA